MLGGESIPLRPKEFEVLLYLVQRPSVVVTRDDLMNIVWGFDYIGGQRTVDVHVSSLRKKLEMNQQSVQIESIRGVGYKLVTAAVKNHRFAGVASAGEAISRHERALAVNVPIRWIG